MYEICNFQIRRVLSRAHEMEFLDNKGTLQIWRWNGLPMNGLVQVTQYEFFFRCSDG